MKKISLKDSIYSEAIDEIGNFTFDERVASVFENMLHRSVPGYDLIIKMIGVMTKKFIKNNSNCYDLGCSLGASTNAIIDNINKKNCKVIAVDNSMPMIDLCNKNLNINKNDHDVNFVCSDLQNIKIKNASIVVMNFTLQFIDIKLRKEIISRVYEGLIPGGLFILSEKVNFVDSKENEFQINAYHSFKRAQGYSDLEISQKQKSLEKVLFPETTETHLVRLGDSGFNNVNVWFKCFNFISMIAIK